MQTAQMAKQTPAERLIYARETLAGFRTATEAARALNVPPPTYLAHENGSRAYGPEDARKYASKFKVDLRWLMWGVGNPRGPDILDKYLALDDDDRAEIDVLIDKKLEKARKNRQLSRDS